MKKFIRNWIKIIINYYKTKIKLSFIYKIYSKSKIISNQTFLYDSKQIIHIGAGRCQERFVYNSFNIKNVIWIEANPDQFRICQKNLLSFKKQNIFNFCIDSTQTSKNFYITSNPGSSSIYKLKEHKDIHPEIIEAKSIKIKTITLDNLINYLSTKENLIINENDNPSLVIDVQGAELQTIKGCSNERLSIFKYLLVETSNFYAYENQDLHHEVCLYLEERNFKPIAIVKKSISKNDRFFTDTLFVNLDHKSLKI